MALTVAIVLALFAPWPWNLVAILTGLGDVDVQATGLNGPVPDSFDDRHRCCPGHVRLLSDVSVGRRPATAVTFVPTL